MKSAPPQELRRRSSERTRLVGYAQQPSGTAFDIQSLIQSLRRYRVAAALCRFPFWTACHIIASTGSAIGRPVQLGRLPRHRPIRLDTRGPTIRQRWHGVAPMRRYGLRPTHTAVAAVLIAFVVLMAANMLVLVKIMGALMEFSSLHQKGQSIPCPAIPTRLILEDPICAQKLLDSMNVANVRILHTEVPVPQTGNGNPPRLHEQPIAGVTP